MKNLFLILSLISFSAFGSNWMPHSLIVEGSNQAHQLEGECIKIHGEICYDVGEYPSSVFSEVDSQIDDLNSPKYSKANVIGCTDFEDCNHKLQEITCDEDYFPVKNIDLWEVYCAKQNGFYQKTIKVIELDSVKLASYQDELAVKAQIQALDNFKAFAKKRRDCGGSILDLMFVRNAQKELDNSQVKQVVSNNSTIQDLLSSGALETAKEEILATTADGVLVTESDKTALVAEIDKCLAE